MASTNGWERGPAKSAFLFPVWWRSALAVQVQHDLGWRQKAHCEQVIDAWIEKHMIIKGIVCFCALLFIRDWTLVLKTFQSHFCFGPLSHGVNQSVGEKQQLGTSFRIVVDPPFVVFKRAEVLGVYQEWGLEPQLSEEVYASAEPKGQEEGQLASTFHLLLASWPAVFWEFYLMWFVRITAKTCESAFLCCGAVSFYDAWSLKLETTAMLSSLTLTIGNTQRRRRLQICSLLASGGSVNQPRMDGEYKDIDLDIDLVEAGIKWYSHAFVLNLRKPNGFYLAKRGLQRRNVLVNPQMTLFVVCAGLREGIASWPGSLWDLGGWEVRGRWSHHVGDGLPPLSEGSFWLTWSAFIEVFGPTPQGP